MSDARLEQLTKHYNDVIAVDQINLNIPDREFLVLVGPSGCGKTTTLRMIAGLERATSGEVWIDSKPVNHISPRDRDIAMVFQSYALYPHMTVEKNLSYSLRIRRRNKKEITNRVRTVAEVLELTPLLTRKPSQLSGGQQQRVALGRAIVREPKLFLMDEPLSNLDAKLRVQTRAELIRLQRDLGITTVYVTHDQTEAMTMGSTIVVMNKGKIQQVDHPQKVYQHPANTFVAQFIGMPPMNLIKCDLDKRDGEVWCRHNKSFNLRLPKRLGSSLFELFNGPEILLGFRPEDVRPIENNQDKGLSFSGEIDVIETLGHEILVYLRHKESESAPYVVRLSLDEAIGLKTGEQFSLEPIWDRLRFFSSENGKAIAIQ